MKILVVDDTSEFGLLIQKVVHKEIPASIEGDDVWLTDGTKTPGRFIRKIAADLPGRNDPCPCCLDNGKNIKWKKCLIHNK